MQRLAVPSFSDMGEHFRLVGAAQAAARRAGGRGWSEKSELHHAESGRSQPTRPSSEAGDF